MAGNGSGPVLRVKLKGKNDAQMTATNRDGTTYKGPQVEVITGWKNENGRLSGQLAKGFTVCYNGKPVPDCFINIYIEQPLQPDGNTGRGPKAADDDEDF